MTHYQLTVSLIFRLINFGVVIYICIFLFKRYVLTALEQEHLAKESISQGLKEKSSMLNARVVQLDREMEQQAQLCEQLRVQVIRWRMLVDQRRAQEHIQAKERGHEIAQRMRDQAQYIIQEQLYKRTMPQAFQEAMQELRRKYAHEHEGQEWLEHIMHQIVDKRPT